ncbi:MetS family NSS transporter small subunit [Pseudodesulfovibrio sp.]
MEFSALLTMLIGLGITWGGAFLCLRIAMRRD